MTIDIDEILKGAVAKKASDLHITVGLPPMMRFNGELQPVGDIPLTQEDTEQIAMHVMNENTQLELKEQGEVDFSFVIPRVSRFRVNVYKQRGSFTVAFRIISISIPTIDSLGFPPILKELALRPRGLILVTGPTGSGKSTTLAAMVNHINMNRSCHVLTLEEPIEYLHKHGKSMINQREVGNDTQNFANGLRAALREDPNVILVGEMRDLETIAIAVTAAETGHLVLSTLHTTSAATTVDRIIDVFPPYQQQQIRVQLAGVLVGIISQQLIPRYDLKGVAAALEILVANTALSNMIREGKTHQIPTIIQTGMKAGMVSMDYSLSELVKKRIITREDALNRASDVEMFNRYMTQNAQ